MSSSLSLSQSDHDIPGASSSATVASLMEKYEQVLADIEAARKEIVERQTEIQQCHQQIQDLASRRHEWMQAQSKASEEQVALQGQIDESARQWQALEQDYQRAVSARDHAQTVRSMLQNRVVQYRQEYEQSRSKFRTACDETMERRGKKGYLEESHPSGAGKVATETLKTLGDTNVLAHVPLASIGNSDGVPTEAQTAHSPVSTSGGDLDDTAQPAQDGSQQAPSPAAAVVSSTTKESLNVLQTDWRALLSRLLPQVDGNILAACSAAQDRQEKHDEEPPTSSLPVADAEARKEQTEVNHDHQTTTKSTEDTENECAPTVDIASAGVDNQDIDDVENDAENQDPALPQDISEQLLSQGSNKSAAATSTRSKKEMESIIFDRVLQEIEAVEDIQKAAWEQTKDRLSSAQAKHANFLEAHASVQNDHKEWAEKVQRQRQNKAELRRQLDRLNHDVESLQAQLSQVESEIGSDRAQQQRLVEGRRHARDSNNDRGGEREGGRKRPRTLSADPQPAPAANHVRGPPARPTAGEIRNPYLKQKTQQPTSSSNRVSLEPHTDHAQRSDERSKRNGRNRSRGATISPFEDRRNRGRALVASSTPVPTNEDRSPHPQQHPHRVGRVRSARGFGVSLSLESSNLLVLRSDPPGSVEQPTNNRRDTKNSPISHRELSENDEDDDLFDNDIDSPAPGDRAFMSYIPLDIASQNANIVSTAKKSSAGRRLARTPFTEEDSSDDDDDDDEVPAYAFRKK